VVGADEWAENVDDNAFTNGVAKVSLQIANKAAKILNLPTNQKWD
jgi:trehalose/maltose hydrolase-like predicted phosphorylase